LQDKAAVYISTYGCQMNVNDSERMYALLEKDNYTPVFSPELADVILINSCSVREKPVHKLHSEVGRYRPLKQKNSRLRIGVGGCVGQQEKSELLKTLPLVDFVFGPDNIDQISEIVHHALEIQKRRSYAEFDKEKNYSTETLTLSSQVSTFVNISKGLQ
jgi:tRNA-2-methylthio-N6-dimethylallyladenosine synthase